MPGDNIHVVYDKKNWQVKREGSKFSMSSHGSQAQAIDVARYSAIAEKSDLIIFDVRGQVQDTDSYRESPAASARDKSTPLRDKPAS
jgi:hypothetical protein